jgi:hypothetical protein
MRPNTMTLALLGTLLAPAAGLAQGKGALAEAALERRTESVLKGPTFRSGGQDYQVLGGVRAVARPRGAGERQTLELVGAAPADLLEAKGSYLVYFQAAGAAPVAAQVAAGPSSTLPVARNKRTGGLGVVLGSLVVRLRDPAAAEALGKEHGLRLLFSAPHLSLAFYRVPQGQDIQAAAAELVRDRRVVSAEVEVKEHFAAPR